MNIELKEVLDLGFMTCNSDGANKKYWVEIMFHELKDAQNLYSYLAGERQKSAQSNTDKPEKIKPATRTLESFGYANGWNECIDKNFTHRFRNSEPSQQYTRRVGDIKIDDCECEALGSKCDHCEDEI